MRLTNSACLAAPLIEVVSDVGCISVAQCPENSECVVTGTKSSCVCRVGYTRDANNTCIGKPPYITLTDSTHPIQNPHIFYINSDINECLLAEGGCDSNSDCVNTAGSFGCLCKLGYTGNGITCTSIYTE